MSSRVSSKRSLLIGTKTSERLPEGTEPTMGHSQTGLSAFQGPWTLSGDQSDRTALDSPSLAWPCSQLSNGLSFEYLQNNNNNNGHSAQDSLAEEDRETVAAYYVHQVKRAPTLQPAVRPFTAWSGLQDCSKTPICVRRVCRSCLSMRRTFATRTARPPPPPALQWAQSLPSGMHASSTYPGVCGA